MSSLIPKILLGQDTKKGKFDLSCMTHTTSEIGYVMPTYSRLLAPKTHLKIGTNTGVRLSPLYVPTMGQIDVRHYHCFVPLSTLWFPFESFITKTNYTLPDGTTYLPSVCPSFSVGAVLNVLLGFYSIEDTGFNLFNFRQQLSCQVYKENNGVYTPLDKTALAALSATELKNIFKSNANLPIYALNIYGGDSDSHGHLTWNSSTDVVGIVADEKSPAWWSKYAIPTNDSCDFTAYSKDSEGKTYLLCYNFNGGLKRLRSVFMGLGYTFNPYDTTQVTLFKLLAFYKCYWTLFGVNRTQNFFNTYCYKLIKKLSDNVVTQISVNGTSDVFVTLISFIGSELQNLTYTCPVDYFSCSDTTTQRGSFGNNMGVNSPVSYEYNSGDVSASPSFVGATNVSTGNQSVSPLTSSDQQSPYVNSASYALAQKIAQRLLTFINKNSVVGKSITNILRARYGVTDIHNNTHEHIIRVGASSTSVNISAIYNNNGDANADSPLGTYAGCGVGANRSKRYSLDTGENAFGIFVTLTAVVPKMGYFQGMFKENSDGVNGSYDFYTPEFDAMGYQALNYNELVADRQHPSYYYHYNIGTDLGVFGYVPRYTHLKCSFNRALGDISIPHLASSMLPYTLDRYFPDHIMKNVGSPQPSTLPVNDPMTFRSGTRGETNRIFSDYSVTDDHVIMQIFFDVKMNAPMKSIATSFDTFDEDSSHSTESAHE